MKSPLSPARPHGFSVSLVGGRVAVSVSRFSAVIGVAVIASMVVLAWIVSYTAGGSHTVTPHLFYIPVVLAAVRFGRVGAIAAGVAAGVAAGPLLPLDVGEGSSQAVVGWVLRGGFFAGVGLIVAFFVHHSKGTIGDELARSAVRRELRRALDSRHLHVAYQPIIDLGTGNTIGAEALIRWSDPDRGSRAPDEFIPAAEAAGIAHLVSDFVLREVAHQLGLWRQAGLVVRDERFELAVNISGTELGDERLESLLRDLIVHERITPRWLHLEITETALVADLEHAIESLQRLRGIGARLSVDDFGTGESTLRHLHRFPVDTLKIDRSFIQPLVDDDDGRFIVQSVIELAHRMGLRTVAEGVETAAHAAILKDLGCDLAQGFHFARPLDPLAFEEHLRAQARQAAPVRRQPR